MLTVMFQPPALKQSLQGPDRQAAFVFACRIAREQALEKIVDPGGHRMAGIRGAWRRSHLH